MYAYIYQLQLAYLVAEKSTVVVFFIFYFAWKAQKEQESAFTSYTVLVRNILNCGLCICKIFPVLIF